MSAKWTAGEVRRIIEDRDGRTALEILSELLGKGPHVIDYEDEGDPEAEAEAKRAAEMAVYDAAIEAEACNCVTGRFEDPPCPLHGDPARKAVAS